MSISLISAPGAIVSAYRPILFKVQSSVVAPELQLRGEISARNNLADPFALLSIKYEKRYLGNNYFIFDLSNVLRTMLTFDRLIALQAPGIITPNPMSIVGYKIKFTEVFYDINGLPSDGGTYQSGILQACNSIPQHYEDQALTDYIIVGTDPQSPYGVGFDISF